MDIKDDLKLISGIGDKTLLKLNKLGLHTIEDFIFHYPFRYEIFKNKFKIKDLEANEKCIFLARVEIIDSKRSYIKRANFTKAILKDDTGKVEAVWFNNSWVKDSLIQGELYCFIGETTENYGSIELVNPLYRKYNLKKEIKNDLINPIYRTTKTLKQNILRNIGKKVFFEDVKIKDYLPESIKEKYNYQDLQSSLKNLHYPTSLELLEISKNRLKFDELFFLQLLNERRKFKFQNRTSYKIKFFEKETKLFIKNFGFDLTDKQKKVTWQILKDLENITPTNRLLEGDVGSGKTVVFLISVLNVFLNNYNSAIMVPTSILAMQHYRKICNLFLNKEYIENINIALLTGSECLLNNEKITKKKLEEKIKNNEVNIIVGTHALVQENVKIQNLALVVIDEQHRFGVKQRHLLTHENINSNSEIYPHFLSVTATPIPRTLALAFYGDLDLSILDEKPLNRKPIKTEIVTELKEVYLFLLKELKEKKQIYIICPLIEETEEESKFELEIKSAKSVFEHFKKLKPFEKYNIEILHGKLKSTEKNKIEKEFSDGNINILISTSVVEVGVDVPNANTIVILGAEKFGLASLYQLRGRVGRSDSQSYCFLYTKSKSEKALDRLHSIIKAKSSFELAEIDMKTRGIGDMYGLIQSGNIPDLKIANIFDIDIMLKAKKEAEEIIQKDPELKTLKELKERINIKENEIHPE